RGIERKNTGYEPQYEGLDIEHQDLYADPDGWRNNAKGAFKVVDPDKKERLTYDENGAFTDGPARGSKDYPAWQRKVEAEKKPKRRKMLPSQKTGNDADFKAANSENQSRQSNFGHQ
ncbi:hypothetical protein QQ056_12395, partial [Oscillatoria laete-virens NRMC-F 0139]